MTSARFDISPNDSDFELFCLDESADAGSCILRTVDEPIDYFLAHPLRIASACRLVAQTGAQIEPKTLQAMKSLKMKLAVSDMRVIRTELDDLLLGEHVYNALMETVDVLVAVMPEIAACRGFAQPTPYHIYDVWEHTAWVVQRSPSTLLSRWAALLHDIGKPAAGFMDGEVVHFFGHAKISAILARSLLERLAMEPEFTEHVVTLVGMHDDKIPAEPEAVQQAVEKLNGDTELFRALCKLKLADALAHSELGEPRVERAQELERLLDAM
ncbi:MAG: HD domain-containing protein [Eggerthellaceae bacterium]|nr:HD domain-containing protein [Eggerthellaceae bacterium]